MDLNVMSPCSGLANVNTLVVSVDEFILLQNAAGKEIALEYVEFVVDREYQVVPVDQFLVLGDTVGFDTALLYLKLSVKARVGFRFEPGVIAGSHEHSRVSSSEAPESLVEMPIPLVCSPSSSKTSLSLKSEREVLGLRTKTGYCYSSILSPAAYDKRVRALRAWPSVVSLLRMSYDDTVGISEMKSFYLRQVDHRGRFHLTTEHTNLPFLDALLTLSFGYKQRFGSVGYYISNSLLCKRIDIPPDFTFTSRIGGDVGSTSTASVGNDYFMALAMAVAKESIPSIDKFCVGAVLTDADTNEILATGYSLELPAASVDKGGTHAEQCCFIKLAQLYSLPIDFPEYHIRNSIDRTFNLYTTMEPCLERKSGFRSCADRICVLRDSIRKVYIGTKEPDTFFQDNSSQAVLLSAGIKVFYMFHLQNECLDIATRNH